MMTVGNSLFAAGFACAAFCMTPADAQLGKPTDGRPVTENDLVGKKICWSNGRTGIFAANGQYTEERANEQRAHHGTWLVTEPGVVRVWNWYTQYEILPDGSFYQHWFHGLSITGHHENWGTVCN
jgi:hypothetical protein